MPCLPVGDSSSRLISEQVIAHRHKRIYQYSERQQIIEVAQVGAPPQKIARTLNYADCWEYSMGPYEWLGYYEPDLPEVVPKETILIVAADELLVEQCRSIGLFAVCGVYFWRVLDYKKLFSRIKLKGIQSLTLVFRDSAKASLLQSIAAKVELKSEILPATALTLLNLTPV